MNFKVGDRVKRIAHCVALIPIGSVGTVTHLCPDGCVGVMWDAVKPEMPYSGYVRETLAPLTPPDSAEWAQSKVRDLFKPVYTEPERVRERT